jgi:ABC-type phosphate transport system substrate-binding protein
MQSKKNPISRKVSRVNHRWLVAICVFLLTLPLISGRAVAQTGTGWQPLNRDAAVRGLTKEIPSGAAVVHINWTSAFVPMIKAIGEALPSKAKIDVARDDHASFGRFCDGDQPFHMVLQEGELTDHDARCQERRFPAGTPQPEAFMVGQLRVVFVANKSNPIESLDFAGIRKALNPTGKTSKWQNVGGVQTAAIHCYGPPESTWARRLVQDKCMSRWRDADTPGVRELQRLDFRDDLASCSDAREVLAKVRVDRHALGFFACCEPLTKHDLQGVKVLPIVGSEGGPAVAPPLDLTIEQAYPLAEPIALYVHPNAPAIARDFCKFATGPEAAKIVQQSGIWPEYLGEQARGRQRLAEIKAGKGTDIVVCDLTGWEGILKDLSLEFVKAKAAVQLKFQKGETRDTAIEKLNKGATDLLLVDKDSGQWSAASGQSVANQKSAEKGTVPGTLRGEGQSPPQSLAEKGTVPGTLQGEGQSPFPRSIELGRMAVGIIVHPENPLESLPMDEARAIFCGEIKKWPAVRGAAAAMHVFGLRNTNPIAQLLKESFNRDPKGSARPATLKCTAQPDNEKVILAVARDPAAIGFVDMSQLPPNDKSVKLVPVFEGTGKSQIPNQQTPNPLSRTLTLYVSPNASQTAKDFADFLTPEHCKAIIAQYNLLPPLHAEEAKLAKATPARERPQIDLASANEPPPLLLDDPDAPESKQRSKREGKAKPSRPAVAQVGVSQEDSPPPSQPKPAKSRPTPPPTSQSPNDFALSDNQLVALLGIGGGVIVLALVIVGRLRAPKGKRLRR